MRRKENCAVRKRSGKLTVIPVVGVGVGVGVGVEAGVGVGVPVGVVVVVVAVVAVVVAVVVAGVVVVVVSVALIRAEIFCYGWMGCQRKCCLFDVSDQFRTCF